MADNNTKIILSAVDQTGAAINSVKAGLGSLQSAAGSLAPLLGGLSGALSVGAFAGFVRGTIDAADGMNDLSQKVGIGIKDLATWQLAAQQSGTSLESVARGVKGLSTYMVEHSAKLRAAGITATDANGAMVQLADLFKAMPDGVQKTALAVQLFGKAGMDMIPMLNLGSAGLAEAQKKAAAYGERMSKLAPMADAFNDQMEELALQSKAAGMNITGYLLPGLIGMSTWMNDLAAGGERNATAMEFLAEKTSWFTNLIPQLRIMVELAERLGPALAFAGVGGDQGKRSSGGRIGKGLTLAQEMALAEKNLAGMAAAGLLDKSSAAGGKTPLQTMLDAQKKRIAELNAQAGDEQMVSVDSVARQYAKKESIAAEKAMADAIEASTKALGAQNEELGKQIYAAEHALEIYGLTESQIADLTLARLRDNRAREEAQDADEATLDYYDKEIAALERIRGAKYAVEAKDTAKKEAEEAAKAWENFARDIESSLTDALMRSFEAGDSFGEAFAKNLKNLFKTMILKAAVQITVGTVAGAASQVTGLNFGGSDGSSGSGGAMSLLSNGSSIYNAFGGISSGYASFATSGVGSALGLGSATAAGYSAPVFASALEGGALLSAGSGTAAGGLSAAGAGIGTAMPYVAAALAVASILGVFDKKKPAPVEWGYADTGAQYAAEGNMYGVPEQGPFGGSLTFGQHLSRNGLSPEQLMDSVSKPLVALDKVLAEYLTDDEISKVATALQARKPVEHGWNSGEIDAVMMERLGVISDTLGGWVDQIGDTVTGSLQERYTAIAQLLAMRDNELIAQMGEDLIALGDGVSEFQKSGEQLFQTLLRLASSASAVNPVLERIGLAAFDTNLTGADAASKLVDLVGGGDAFAAKTGAYYQEFFTDAERRADTLGDLAAAFGELDLVLPTSRDGFRGIVEGLDLTTDAGRETFNALMNLSPAFASVADAAGNAGLKVLDAWWGATQAIEKAQSAAAANASIMSAVSQNVRDTTSAMRGFIESFVDFRAELLGSDLSPAGGLGQNAALLDQLRSASALAAKGDKDAMGDLPGIIRSYLASSQNLAVDQEDYMQAFSRSAAALDLATAGAEYKIERTQRGMMQTNAALSGNALPDSFYAQPRIPKSAVETNAVLAEIIGLRADTQATNRRLDRIERHSERTADGVNGRGGAPMLVKTT